MNFLRGPASAFIAFVSLAGPAAAAPVAGARACVTRTEAQALISFGMPGVIGGIAGKCRAALPSGAFVNRSGEALASQLRPSADAAWPSARDTFGRISGQRLPAGIDDSALRSVFEGIFAATIVDKVKVQDCGLANDILETLAPLPPANLTRLVTMLMELGLSKSQDEGFRVCPAA